MKAAEMLEVGSPVTLGVGGKIYDGKVKKIKDDMVAVAMTGTDKDSVAVGDQASLSWSSGEGSFKARGKIIQTKAFPIVVGRFGEAAEREAEAKEAKTKEEEATADYDPEFDKKYLAPEKEGDESARQSARVEDAFPIKFFVVDQDTIKAKRRDYLGRRSKDRREESKISTDFNESQVMEKLAKANPAVIEVIIDLYQKYAILSDKVFKKEVKGGGEESSATCVDMSGSGLQFLTKRQVAPGTVVKFIISPPASPPFSISAMGEIMRVEKKKDPLDNKTKYAYGCRYYAIHEEDTEEIIQYTFKRQQEMLAARRRSAGYD